MWLLIDVKDDDTPNWEGFNFIVNRNISSARETSIEACKDGWDWKHIGHAHYRTEGNQMHIAIQKKLLGIKGNSFVIEFKWIDNTQKPSDILDLYINGDSAPNGRFRYRYKTHVREIIRK
jgi:hypothetical protein